MIITRRYTRVAFIANDGKVKSDDVVLGEVVPCRSDTTILAFSSVCLLDMVAPPFVIP
jgi:hypothetical protein